MENNEPHYIVNSELCIGDLTRACCCTDSKGSACAAFPEGQRFQPRQSEGALVPVAYLEEATPGGFPVRYVGAPTTASGLLRWRLAPPRQRYCVNSTDYLPILC